MDGVTAGETRAVPVPGGDEETVVRHGVRPQVRPARGEIRLRDVRMDVRADDAQPRDLVVVGPVRVAVAGRCERLVLRVGGRGGRSLSRRIQGDAAPDEPEPTAVQLEAAVE